MNCEELPKLSVSVLLEFDERLMMVKEANPKYFGLWNQPQGRMEDGETIREAAIREAKEETGLHIELISLFATYICPTKDGYIHNHCFRARPITRDKGPICSEILDTRWFSRTELLQGPKHLFRSPLTILRSLHWLRINDLSIGVIEVPRIA